jgi:hypothetical protein
MKNLGPPNRANNALISFFRAAIYSWFPHAIPLAIDVDSMSFRSTGSEITWGPVDKRVSLDNFSCTEA